MTDDTVSEKQLMLRHSTPTVRRGPSTISLLEAKVVVGERAARTMLQRLEATLVRCGYTRDAVYRGSHDRAIVIRWEEGKILLQRGYAIDPRTGDYVIDRKLQKKQQKDWAGKPWAPLAGRVRKPAATSETMTAEELITVAHHLAPFVDALEGKVRHLVQSLERAISTIRDMLERIEADPRPSDEPAQMPCETG